MPTFINNTITENILTYAGSGRGCGIYVGNGFAQGKNNIVINNPATTDPNYWGMVNFTYSLSEPAMTGTGNIAGDPLFVDGPSGQYYLSQTASGQAINSPCIDAGDPSSTMIIGTNRTDQVQDAGIVDIGFHYQIVTVVPPPPISVTLTPVGMPIQIPANGGMFAFNISLANDGTSPETFDIWTMITLPNGSQYGPVINFPNFTAPANWSGGRDRTQAVPASAPMGNYVYNAYLGDFPDVVIASDEFDFSKLAAGDNGFVYGWEQNGESFDEIFGGLEDNVPGTAALMSVYPNPFNPMTTISFELTKAGNVSLKVYDISGRKVAQLMNEFCPSGSHEISFDASNLASGVYLAKIQTGDFKHAQKLLLMK